MLKHYTYSTLLWRAEVELKVELKVEAEAEVKVHAEVEEGRGQQSKCGMQCSTLWLSESYGHVLYTLDTDTTTNSSANTDADADLDINTKEA